VDPDDFCQNRDTDQDTIFRKFPDTDRKAPKCNAVLYCIIWLYIGKELEHAIKDARFDHIQILNTHMQ
jgi:hypothetical protein